MKKIETDLEGVYIIEPKVFQDHRGFFMETWSKKAFENLGLFYEWVQDNHSCSTVKGTIRGIHFQKGEYAQAKLVRCTRGAVRDIIVDLRPDSLSFKKWISVELSEDNYRCVIIPRGFGHGFVTLTDHSEFMYKVDNEYNKESEGGIIWNDPDLAISWDVDNPVLSDKDKLLPNLKEIDFNSFWLI